MSRGHGQDNRAKMLFFSETNKATPPDAHPGLRFMGTPIPATLQAPWSAPEGSSSDLATRVAGGCSDGPSACSEAIQCMV